MDYLLYVWQETEVCVPSPVFADQGTETQKGGVIHVQDQAGHPELALCQHSFLLLFPYTMVLADGANLLHLQQRQYQQ